LLYVLYTLFFLSCIALVGSVLLQPGKTDAGALFTSNVSSNAFGPRGTATVLGKITIVAAVIFMISALLISMPAFNGGTSVLNSTAAETPADSNSNTDANAASNTATDNSNVATIPLDASNVPITSANSSANSNSVLIQAPPVEQLGNQTSNTRTSASTNANVGKAANSAKPTPKK